MITPQTQRSSHQPAAGFCLTYRLQKIPMAELIRLDRPPADFCISLSGLSPTLEVSKLESYLRELGGPVWSLVVHENSEGQRWAMAFFYCESDCEKCRQQCDGLVLAGRTLSTRRLTKLRGSSHPAAGREGIPASKAIDCINHYVGFNQWSSELLGLTPAMDARAANAAGGGGSEDVFVARVRVTLASGLEVTAEATNRDFASSLDAETSNSTSEPTVDWERRAQHKKAAVTAALKAALAKLCLIRFPNGKVVVRALEEAATQPPTAGPHQHHDAQSSSACYSRNRILPAQAQEVD